MNSYRVVWWALASTGALITLAPSCSSKQDNTQSFPGSTSILETTAAAVKGTVDAHCVQPIPVDPSLCNAASGAAGQAGKAGDNRGGTGGGVSAAGAGGTSATTAGGSGATGEGSSAGSAGSGGSSNDGVGAAGTSDGAARGAAGGGASWAAGGQAGSSGGASGSPTANAVAGGGSGGDVMTGDDCPNKDPKYSSILYNSEGDDDECKYHMRWVSSIISGNQNMLFTVSVTNKADGSPVSGADPSAEIFFPCDLSHAAPTTSDQASAMETSPGVYDIGPVRFDKSGHWAVRFHLFRSCKHSAPRSPYGHAAFYVNVP